MFDEEIVFFQKKNIKDRDEAINFLVTQLENHNIVKKTFRKAILQRENRYPTGLSLDGFGVAIPHADSIHVNKNQIAIMTLKKPVVFQQMSDVAESVKVEIIFMLALKEPKAQLATLKSLMLLLQKKNNVKKMLTLPNSVGSMNSLKNILQVNGVV